MWKAAVAHHLLLVFFSVAPFARRSGRTGVFPLLMMLPCETVNGKPVRKLRMPFVCQPARTAPATPFDRDLTMGTLYRKLMTTTCVASKPTRLFSAARLFGS